MRNIKNALKELGYINWEHYLVHSLQSEVATAAAVMEIEDSVIIKTLGCWESSKYIRVPRDQLRGASELSKYSVN